MVVRFGRSIDSEGVERTLGAGRLTFRASYNHSAAAALFAPNVTAAMLGACAAEMLELGYTEAGWVPLRGV